MVSGISGDQIIRINLEDYEFLDIENYGDLCKYVNSKLVVDKVNYVFIDEVQRVIDFQKACDNIKKNVDYITKGLFPYVWMLNSSKDIRMYLDGIYNTVIVNDIAEGKEISDIGMLKDVIKFMFDNVGNLCSSTSVANTMTSNGRKISVPTIEKYLEAFEESFVLYKVSRYREI